MTDIGRLRKLAEQAALIAEKKRWDDSPKYFSTGWTKDTFIPFARWYDDIAAALNAAPHLLSEVETLRTQSGSLFDAIQHGDDEHRAWLKAAITAHFAGEPVPPPSGSGRKDAEIETLRARLAAAERVVEKARRYVMLEWESLDLPELNTQRKYEGLGSIPASEIALGESIAAYDQGKVTICDSSHKENTDG